MGKVIKGIGSVISAPVRGIGHALGTSGIPLVSNVGRAAEDVGNAVAGKGAFFRDIGKAGEQAAPVAGLIPGVGPLAGAALGMGGGLLDKGFNKSGFEAGLAPGLEGAASGFLGNKLLGGQGFEGFGNFGKGISDLGGDLGGIASKVGQALPLGLKGGNPLDVGKLAAGAGSIANMIGQGQQRSNAQNYANANIDMRNKLMSSILSGVGGGNRVGNLQTYGPNMNQQPGAS